MGLRLAARVVGGGRQCCRWDLWLWSRVVSSPGRRLKARAGAIYGRTCRRMLRGPRFARAPQHEGRAAAGRPDSACGVDPRVRPEDDDLHTRAGTPPAFVSAERTRPGPSVAFDGPWSAAGRFRPAFQHAARLLEGPTTHCGSWSIPPVTAVVILGLEPRIHARPAILADSASMRIHQRGATGTSQPVHGEPSP